MTPSSSTHLTSARYADDFNHVRARVQRHREDQSETTLPLAHPLRFEETKRAWPEPAQQPLPLSAAPSPADSDDGEPLDDAALIFHLPREFDELGADVHESIVDFLALADMLAMRQVSRGANEMVMSVSELAGVVNASREYERTDRLHPQPTVSRFAVLESAARWTTAGSVLAFSFGGLARVLIAIADIQRTAFYAGRSEPEDLALDWARFGMNVTVGGSLVLAIAAEKVEHKAKTAQRNISREHERAVGVAQANLRNAVSRFEIARVRARRDTTADTTS